MGPCVTTQVTCPRGYPWSEIVFHFILFFILHLSLFPLNFSEAGIIPTVLFPVLRENINK